VIYAANRRRNFFVRDIAIKVSPFDKSSERRGEKQPAQVEYDIQEAVRKVAWGGVILPLKFVECKDFVSVTDMNNINNKTKNIDPHHQYVLFMERADGGSLRDWIRANLDKLTDADLLKMIRKVLMTLDRILTTYPEFRHNDLYLDNILMHKGEPKLADFGWSRLKKTGTNPAVNTALANGIATRFGIGPDTSSRYDMHLFLNELRRFITRLGKFPVTRAFLEKSIPVGYREFSDTYTVDGRLKYGVQLPGLPNIKKILEDKAMTGRVSPPKAKSASPPRPAPTPRPAPKVKSASPRKNYTNEEFIGMTPRQFLKLSPATRARAAAVRRANKGKGPAQPNKPRANSATNATAKRRASPRRAPARATGGARISPRTLRSNKFNRFAASLLNTNSSSPYQSRWNAARAKAIKAVEARLNAGKPAFSPSPMRRLPSPLSPLSPARPPRLPSPLSPLGPPPARRSPSGVVKSAGSGRYKVTGPSGRLVYANGSAVSMDFIKALASRKGVNTKGLRSKEAIARAIFNRK
jgi:serine/threonine protein kinase